MGALVAVASFPKSGNTWLRAFLTAAFGGTGAVDINRLPIHSLADRAIYDRYLGISSSLFTLAELASLRHAVFTQVARSHERHLILKVHDAWSDSLLPAELLDAVIYVVRDPRDIAISLASHVSKPFDEVIALMNSPSATLRTNPQAWPTQLPQYIGTWSHHVSSWLGGGHRRVLLVRYEDMVANADRVFGNVMRFLGVDLSPEALRVAIEAVSFQELSQQEEQSGFRERPRATARFFRQGHAEAWKNVLTERQAQQISELHRSVMGQMGYEH